MSLALSAVTYFSSLQVILQSKSTFVIYEQLFLATNINDVVVLSGEPRMLFEHPGNG